MLATTEASQPVFAIGQSNSGMVDPLHMTAITLTGVTTALLTSRPNLDRTICIKVMLALMDDVGTAASKVEHANPKETSQAP
jgi:hypothetical protein